MSCLKFALVLVMFLVFATQLFVIATFAELSENEAVSTLATAEGTVISAYQAVLNAEEAGANVSDLLVQLNRAGEYLARAHMEYRQGNFEKATDFANSGRSIGEEVQSAAVELKDSALSEGLQRMVFTMIASVLGVAVIALGSLWIWHFLKKRYSSGSF